MLSSGRVSLKKSDKDTTSTIATSQLTDVELNLLDAFYRETNPRYSMLCREYEHALQQAKNARNKSTFPKMPQWIPAQGYQMGDKELLCGPQNHIHVYKKMSREDVQTGRMVFYSSEQYETFPSRHLCSFVRVLKDGLICYPVLGRIKKLFSHQFGSCVYKLAVLQHFDSPQRDVESRLWVVNLTRPHDHLSVVPLDILSHPLVVAFENQSLWFLNCV